MKTKSRSAGLFFLLTPMLVCAVAGAGQRILFGGNRVPTRAKPAGKAIGVGLSARAVAGFPTLIRLSILVSQGSCSEWLVDLAAGRGVAIADLALGFDNDAGDGYQMGTVGFWSTHPSGDARGPKMRLSAGEAVSYWFDVGRLSNPIWARPKVQGKEYTQRVKEPIPVVGTWTVSVMRGDLLALREQRIKVRKPNPDEKRIMELLETKGAGLSWFPDVVLEGGEIPEELVQPLPVETRRTVRLIMILRAAFVSPQDGLDAIYLYASEDWGYLHALVDLVQYECLRELDRNKEAETVRARWKDDNALIVNFRLVDEGMGLIARFHKDIERRRLVEQLAKRPRMQNR